MKTLVMYFSAESGRTAALAKVIAEEAAADLFEIKPKKLYSKADLNYLNPLSRVNLEKIGNKEVPTAGVPDHFEQYEKVLIGFPIWYAGAPNVITSFCKSLERKEGGSICDFRRIRNRKDSRKTGTVCKGC